MIDKPSMGFRMPVRKNQIMFALSIVMGGAAVFYSRQYIEDQVDYYKSQLDKTETMVEVVVPNRILKRGEILLASDLSIREVPEKYADSHSVTSGTYEIAVGQRLDFDIDEGRALLWAHLEGGLTPTFSGKVEDGFRAMTVRVDEINSMSGFLQPKDKVDLLLSYSSGSNYQIFPLIQKLDVIATGVQTIVDKSSSGRARAFSTITVHVSPTNAQKITLAQQVGKITALLRNPDDEGPMNELPMTVAQLLNEPVPIEPEPAPVKRTPRRSKPKPSVEYIIGGRP
ncbi:MAG: pilus assembly protein CpaB [Granulosicoccus sp.]|jgi:pilus assembly protein CpaB